MLQGLLDEVADLLTVTSEPAGAAVEVQRLAEEGAPESAVVPLGVTPVASRRLARGEYRVMLRLPGRAVAERIASSAYRRSVNLPREGRVVTLHVPIPARDSVPDDVVLVPGGVRELRNPDLPVGLTAQLQPFVIDRFEVTNDAFRAFVRAGGYAERAHWPEWTGPGSPADRLVDRTGLPAPRGWRAQSPPEGTGTHPVTGVSWYEAAAFCRSRGMRLPTLFEWDQAGRPDADVAVEVMMPWGAMSAIGAADRRANFRGSGTMPVGSHPFGVGPWGAHDMAGNVKEWLANAVGQGFAFTGGSWQDPAYLFTEVGALEPGAANASLGFRCARTHGPGLGDQGAMPLRLGQAAPVYRPVDAATFRSFLNFYRYDPRAPRARGIQRTETPDWTRERLWIDGVGSDSILVYLYLPRQATPPFQTIVSVPSSAAFFFQPVWRAVEDDLGPHVANGRAVLAIVFDGMLERNGGVTGARPAPSSVEFRDLMVRHATELRMGMDYLATRPEIDTAKLAYHGVSWGAGSRLGFAAVDDRFKAVVLVGAGIDERVQPTLPEAANFNFAPHIRAPKLMVNGRQDEEHPWATRAKPLWDLLREPKELVLADGVGHHPPAEVMVPAVRSFLDRVLGPVTASPRRGGPEVASPRGSRP